MGGGRGARSYVLAQLIELAKHRPREVARPGLRVHTSLVLVAGERQVAGERRSAAARAAPLLTPLDCDNGGRHVPQSSGHVRLPLLSEAAQVSDCRLRPMLSQPMREPLRFVQPTLHALLLQRQPVLMVKKVVKLLWLGRLLLSPLPLLQQLKLLPLPLQEFKLLLLTLLLLKQKLQLPWVGARRCRACLRLQLQPRHCDPWPWMSLANQFRDAFTSSSGQHDVPQGRHPGKARCSMSASDGQLHCAADAAGHDGGRGEGC